MNTPNFFLAFEGLDGSGKTTISESVYSQLNSRSDLNTYFVNKKEPPFYTDYTERHSSHLREILWNYPKDAPMHELGDMHWLHLLAAWFHFLDNTQIRPSLSNRHNLIMESWCYKYLVRYRLKSDYMYEAMQAAFFSLTKPTPIVYLDIDPVIAAERKKTFGVSESGGMDGLRGNSRDDFISYQTTLRDIYIDFAKQGGWHIIDVSHRDIKSITDEVVSLVLES